MCQDKKNGCLCNGHKHDADDETILQDLVNIMTNVADVIYPQSDPNQLEAAQSILREAATATQQEIDQ